MSPSENGRLHSVLLYAHDTYGLGHLRRNLAIASHLLEGRPGLRAVLMTGSPVAERFDLPAGLDLVRLPPVVKVGPEQYRPRDRRLDPELVRRVRGAIMADVARRFAPEVFLVDHAPQGMRGELLPVFSALRSASPSTRIVLGLRDVVDDSATVRRVWSEQDVYATLEERFDRVLVYGSAAVLDVAAEYRLSGAIAAKVTYCGYLARPVPPATEPEPGSTKAEDALVLGTAGGGGDGADVLSATLNACAALGARGLVVTGPLMDASQRAALERQAAESPLLSVVEFHPALGTAMATASAVVTMGGYNTLCELVAIGVPTVVVPRQQPRREQAIRAELFARRGLVRVVEPGRDLAGRVAEALKASLGEGRRFAPACLDLGGLGRVGDVLDEEAVAARRSRGQRVRSFFEPARASVPA